MFRNLILLIAVIAAAWLVSRMLKKNLSKPSQRTKIESQNMVKCERCEVYLPQDQAIEDNGHYFCSTQHLEDWRQKR